MEKTLTATPQPMDPPTFADNIEAEQDLDIELGPITVQEVKDAIKKQKNGRASGTSL